ncbi:MAG TPA: ABC transporter ATP-binding protein [Mesotoga sp.]|nr:ABC transporter ATP-binding protein [Mesotoga sp.]NLX32765.1 ABC transporter ATP-binding protein [Thermotogaceae bacterium]MDD4039704.1 ABC transporter ATP-binding protein [Mesotoga sp.]MDD4478177.1 ABC transporter ATP-binding protein [Mesotoga sp.]MDD5744816.1 ABC transporter ATP-binding protein [Mesotoga sp.]
MEDFPVLEMKHISKSFPGVMANDDISLQLKKGEVHALLGENGAGKTTLMNILFGIYHADRGEVFINNGKVSITSPSHALKYGIGMVQQHFTLVPSFTVAENVVLGLKDFGFVIKTKTVESKIKELSEAYGLPVNPRARVWTLSVGERQRIEILKLLYTGAGIIILDEPTAVLTPQESDMLFKAIRKLVSEGSSVIFISHKLDEVLAISDRITVLRGGKVVGTVEREKIDRRGLVRMMVGRDVLLDQEKPVVETGRAILKIENLNVKNDKDLMSVRDLSLEIRSGEILGIAGVAGNGQRELAEAIYGLRKKVSGRIELDGHELRQGNVAERIRAGLSFIPQDRKTMATCPNLSVMSNLFMKNSICELVHCSPWKLDGRRMHSKADELIGEFSISTPSAKTEVRYLSGGNLQKVVLARELSNEPKVIIAEHPTRGLDIGAMEFVYKSLLSQKERGAAILLLAGELYEIFRLSDRVAVIYEGQIMGYTPPDPSYIEEIGFMMAGARQEDH